MIDRRNWRPMIENVVRKSEMKKKYNGKGIYGFIFLNEFIFKNNNKKCNLTLV